MENTTGHQIAGTPYCVPFWSLACISQWLSQGHDVRWIICNHIVSEVVVVTCKGRSSIGVATLNDCDPYPQVGPGSRPSAVGAKRGGFRPLPGTSEKSLQCDEHR